MDDKTNKELCLSLLHSETEEEVIEILKRNKYWDDRSLWKPYGNIQNNRGIVSNQQSSSVASLVEKLVNSIDAVLTSECYSKGIDPTSRKAPQSMQEAAEIFFGIKEGHLQCLDAAQRTKIAERIQLVATGSREKPAYVIIDDGEGQPPDEFTNTFLSLLRENKTKIPFVQGKFNMGGTGVLQFAGENSFQLIISKRQPYAPTESKMKDKWGFTLVRRLYPDEEHPQSMYVFLSPNDEILSFYAESLPLRPGRYPSPYSSELNAGSCIKVWNYKMQKGLKSLATLDLRYELERYLPEPILPIRIYERRSYKANYYDTTMSGLNAVLADNPENVEFSDNSTLHVNNVGEVKVRTVIIKELDDPDKAKRYPAGLFFIVNGQLQGEENEHFISRKTNFAYLANSIIILTDCNHLPSKVREDLFMASRDRMRQIEEKTVIEDAIIEYIKEHPAIRQLNAARRQRKSDAAISQEETAKILQNLIKADPILAHLFGKGDILHVPGKDISQIEPYEGQKFPTYFKIHNEPKEGLIKHCPLNRQCRIEFDTDAANGYFERLDDPGHLECSGLPTKISQNLWNGKATVKFGLPAGINIGDEFKIKVQVNDISRLEPFTAEFRIHVDPEAIDDGGSSTSHPTGSMFASLPQITPIYRDKWASEDFNEYSALRIRPGGDDGESLDFAINMDNIFLKNEIAKRKNLDPKILNYWFIWGLVLLSLGMITAEKQKKQYEEIEQPNNSDEESIYERIGKASEGLSMTIVPVIYNLNQKSFNDATES
jgi:hypothetical protein